MNRISTNLPNDNLQYYTRQRQVALNESQNRMAAQTRILNLRDDPAAAAHATRHQSYLTRLKRYNDNIGNSINHYRVAEGHIRHSVDILQEIRAIAVMGANGTYSAENLKVMGTEVNELLKGFIESANAVDADGASIFSGNRSQNRAWRVINGRLPNVSGSVAQNVEYIGDIGTRQIEIADGTYIEINFPGNKLFWAEKQQLYSPNDARDYVVSEDSIITVNGENIQLREGDNIYQIIARINDAPAEIKAGLDPVSNGLVLESSVPRQIWIADEEGSALQDLGIIDDQRPPGNVAPGVQVFGGSAFDAIIQLRDNLFQGDTLDVGGDGIRSIDSALNTALSSLGDLGAKTSRMEIALKRNEKEIGDVTENSSRITDIDFTKALTEFSMLELTHRAALSISARIIQPTLLDFLG